MRVLPGPDVGQKEGKNGQKEKKNTLKMLKRCFGERTDVAGFFDPAKQLHFRGPQHSLCVKLASKIVKGLACLRFQCVQMPFQKIKSQVPEAVHLVHTVLPCEVA